MTSVVTSVRLWAYAHSPPRGVWGHAPPENFGNFDSLRAFLMQSGTSFWTDFCSNFYFSTLQTPRIMTELCCCNFVVWACDKMGGLSPPCFQSGGAEAPPAPPYFSAPVVAIIFRCNNLFLLLWRQTIHSIYYF